MSQAPKPGHSDAIVAYVLAGGVRAAAASTSACRRTDLHDELQKEIDAGMPPPDSNDPRFLRGKIYAIAADAAFALAGITR